MNQRLVIDTHELQQKKDRIEHEMNTLATRWEEVTIHDKKNQQERALLQSMASDLSRLSDVMTQRDAEVSRKLAETERLQNVTSEERRKLDNDIVEYKGALMKLSDIKMEIVRQRVNLLLLKSTLVPPMSRDNASCHTTYLKKPVTAEAPTSTGIRRLSSLRHAADVRASGSNIKT